MNGDGRCISCGGELFKEPLFKSRNMPANVQNLPTREELSADHGIDLELCQCSMCGLIQFDCEPVEYWKDSVRVNERSTSLIEINRKHFSFFVDTYNLRNKKIIEIGSGKGGFLQTLSEVPGIGSNLYGIENNPDFVEESLSLEMSRGGVRNIFIDDPNIELQDGPFDAFYCFSYPARLVNPNVVLQGIRNNLRERGYGFLRTISAEYISNRDGFFEITHDLYAYYSEESLRILLQKNGFTVLDTWLSLPYVCAIVQKREPVSIGSKWEKYDELIQNVRDFIASATDNRKLAVWCASHYAFTVISVCGIGDKVSYIMDNAKAKQGRYAPASHVRIVEPSYYYEEPVDTILILGDFYREEIVSEIRNRFGYDIKIASMNQDGIQYLE